MAYRHRRPLRVITLACTAVLAAALAFSPSAQAGPVSPRIESYLFAASEALTAKDPGLALVLLKRARAEEPEACIVQEYLCRTYLELGDLEGARAALRTFTGCMEPADAPIREELERRVGALAAIREAALLTGEGEAAGNATQGSAGLEAGDGGRATPTTGPAGASMRREVDPDPVAGVAHLSTPVPVDRRIRTARLLMATGGALALGFGTTATLTWLQGQDDQDSGDWQGYEQRKPLNNVSVILAGTGGGVSLAGLVLELVVRGRAGGSVVRPVAWRRIVAPRLEIVPARQGGRLVLSGAF